MDKNVPVVIGNLMLGRCFTLAGVPFVGITSRGDLRITYSRKCIRGYQMPNPEKDMEGAFQTLVKIVEEIGEGHPFYCSNDGHLKMMLKYWEDMRRMFRFVSVDKDVLETILNKEKFIDFARKNKFPIPATYSRQELDDARQLEYPVMIKPIIRLNWFDSEAVRRYGGKHYKGILIENADQFQEVRELVEKENIEYVVQQYIPGPESNIISFHSFFTETSQPLGYFVGRKIRTYPSDYGESCALRLTDYPGVVEMSLELLERIQFKGPIKIDYKLDERTGKLYLLELNPTRYNMWHYLGARGGVNIPYLAYQYLIGMPMNGQVTNWRKDIVWFNFVNDVQAFWELRQKGKISFWQWLQTYRGKRIYKTLALDDLPPVLYGIRMTIKGVFRRIRRMLG
ncbi:MAG: hypothetical protein GXO78_02950 [Calditrichaeota bacterium]|nr:hypothetical protein [Calditrichota bacterium]